MELVGVLIGGLISLVSIWVSQTLSNKSTWDQKHFDLLVNCYTEVFSCLHATEQGRNSAEIKSLSIAIEKASLVVSQKSYFLMKDLLVAVIEGYAQSPKQAELEILLRNSAKEDMRNCQGRKYRAED